MNAKPVWRTAYEVTEKGMEIVEAHRADKKAYINEGMEIASKYGATAFQPGYGSGILSLAFEGESTPHPDFRDGGKFPDGRTKWVPNKRRPGGKAAVEVLKSLRQDPDGETLAHALGYKVASAPMDGYKIYWATAYDFGPTGGPVFLHIPRQAGDGWEPDASLLTEKPESALMLAMEAHNAKVKEINAKAPQS